MPSSWIHTKGNSSVTLQHVLRLSNLWRSLHWELANTFIHLDYSCLQLACTVYIICTHSWVAMHKQMVGSIWNGPFLESFQKKVKFLGLSFSMCCSVAIEGGTFLWIWYVSFLLHRAKNIFCLKVPTPAAFFQPLYTLHNGNFKVIANCLSSAWSFPSIWEVMCGCSSLLSLSGQTRPLPTLL